MTEDSIDISIGFAGLKLANPVFTVSGTCGYADELADFMDLNALGGFITKSITVKPREGNPPPRKIPVIEEKLAETVVFVNVAGETIGDYVAVIERLASERAIAGFELNISCPNVARGGITFGTDPAQVAEITSAAKRAAGDKVLMVKLSPCVTDISVIARAAVDAGADALSMVNTFTAMVIDIETRRPVLANRTGGLSGPAIRPVAVYLVNKVYGDVTKEVGIPILGVGGIRCASDAVEFLIAGASAVGVGTASFIQPDCATRLVEGIKKYCTGKNMSNISELVGSLVTD